MSSRSLLNGITQATRHAYAHGVGKKWKCMCRNSEVERLTTLDNCAVDHGKIGGNGGRAVSLCSCSPPAAGSTAAQSSYARDSDVRSTAM
jgi:hypothetical protein